MPILISEVRNITPICIVDNLVKLLIASLSYTFTLPYRRRMIVRTMLNQWLFNSVIDRAGYVVLE